MTVLVFDERGRLAQTINGGSIDEGALPDGWSVLVRSKPTPVPVASLIGKATRDGDDVVVDSVDELRASAQQNAAGDHRAACFAAAAEISAHRTLVRVHRPVLARLFPWWFFLDDDDRRRMTELRAQIHAAPRPDPDPLEEHAGERIAIA